MELELRRLALHEILVGVLGSQYVYFQPPANVLMVYPCIVYNRERGESKFANNSMYLFHQRYSVTLIERDVDSATFEKIVSLPLTTHERHFAVDKLNHDVFTLYF